MTFYIEKIKINLAKEHKGLRLVTHYDEYFLPCQSFAESKDIITKNFKIVKERYNNISSTTIANDDINEVSLKIVLYYFYLYNLWKNIYDKEKERNLTFQEVDFNHPNTNDKIIQYFKNKYVNDYVIKCTIMLGISIDEFLIYQSERAYFYEMF